jgi:transposase
MGFIHGVNRHEEILCPERLDDYIAEDNPVRFIDAFVDTLDLEALGFQRTKPAATGRLAYHPADLLKLHTYGDLYRLRSSRRPEQETHRTIALLWLLKKLQPDHKTIPAFRKNNLAPLRQICRAFMLLGKQLNLFAGELVAHRRQPVQSGQGQRAALHARQAHEPPPADRPARRGLSPEP